MKKDDWIKIFVSGIIVWLAAVGGGGLYFMVIDKLFLAYWLGVPVILFVIMLICIKYFSESEKDRVIETLKEFINPLISDLEEKIHRIDRSLSGEQFAQSDLLIRQDYKYAHKDILGNKNYKWIKEKVEEYNELVRAKRFEEAKGIANELKGKLKKLKGKHVEELGIGEKEIEKKKYPPITALR